jgi:ribonuclease R
MNMTKILKHSSGTIEFTRSGNAFLISNSRRVDKDIFIPRNKTGKALNGDLVFVKLTPKQEGEYVGEVVGIQKRFRTEFVGVLERFEVKTDKGIRELYVMKTFSKRFPIEIIIYPENISDAQAGDKVVVKLTRWSNGYKRPSGVVKKVLGKAGEHNTEINSILFENNIDSTFPSHVLEEAEQISFDIPQEEILKREDFRNTLTFTIDPADAKDFDDALSFRQLSENVFEVGVHIADVGHYMKPGSNLDKEAYKRTTSTYLVDRVIPMLPERLSNGVCSLRPNEDKLVFSVIFDIQIQGQDYKILKKRFVKAVIRSGKRYAYEDAQQVIEQGFAQDEFDKAVLKLDEIAKAIRYERFKHGAVSFEKKEVKFKLDSDGAPIGVFFKESRDSNKLIEEFMLLANQTVATFVGEQGLSCIYRTHALPTLERLHELSAFVSQFGYEFKVTENEEENKNNLNKLLAEVRQSNHANIIETVAVRSMSKAIYTTEVLGHYGLGFKYYSHFTSPIRRYPDVILHRILYNVLKSGTHLTYNLQEQCDHCSELENRATKAERDSIKFKQAEYMQSRIGSTFEGIVSGVNNWGLFVEIKENGCDGLIDFDEMSNLGFVLDEKNYKFVGPEEKGISLGDTINVIVNGVNLTKRQIDLSLNTDAD